MDQDKINTEASNYHHKIMILKGNYECGECAYDGFLEGVKFMQKQNELEDKENNDSIINISKKIDKIIDIMTPQKDKMVKKIIPLTNI